MKRIISMLLACSLLFMTLMSGSSFAVNEKTSSDFFGTNDPRLPDYVEETVYENLSKVFDSEDYIIERVDTSYVSREYIEELEYNSKSNIFFGYTLSELADLFQDNKYIFTLGENGETIIKEFEYFEDTTYNQILKNVVIGSGVIIICVTVSAVTAGSAAPISMLFACAAKSGTEMALSASAISGTIAGIVTGIETGNFKEALKSATLKGSESFKWGAIAGGVSGFTEGLITINYGTNTIFFKEGTTQALKYPEGIKYTTGENGEIFPNFYKYAKKIVKFDKPTLEAAEAHTGLCGQYYWDAKLANKACHLKSTPIGYVWHHVEDMQTMLLVPQEIHSIAFGGIKHTGGASLIKEFLGL